MDLDPQGNTTSAYGIMKRGLEHSTYTVILDNDNINDAIVKTNFKVDVLPSSTKLAGAVVELMLEIVFSPIGYRITKKWHKESVGKPYLDYIGRENGIERKGQTCFGYFGNIGNDANVFTGVHTRIGAGASRYVGTDTEYLFCGVLHRLLYAYGVVLHLPAAVCCAVKG